jgi:hypothetical protein
MLKTELKTVIGHLQIFKMALNSSAAMLYRQTKATRRWVTAASEADIFRLKSQATRLKLGTRELGSGSVC